MSDTSNTGIDPEAMPDVARAIADAWRQHDKLALAAMTPTQRQAQLEARDVLFDLVDDYRRAAEQQGIDVDHVPEWQIVAAMRDLTEDIRDTAGFACIDDDRHGRT